MDEIWHSKELVKYMIDEYIEKVIIYKIHPMWNLVVVKYVNDCEFWGTIKSKRYKNSETFFDERFCRHGLEFQAWILDNSTHCFSYDSAGHTISYNGTHEVYSGIPKGTYTFIEFDKILHDTEWIGSFPLYDFENQKPLPQEPPLDYEKRVSVIPTEVS